MSTRKQWVKLITEAWQKSVESIIETGDLLVQAQDDLVHGEWIPMIEQDLPFVRQTVNKLIAVAQNPVIRNDAHVRHLPASWGAIDEMLRHYEMRRQFEMIRNDINQERDKCGQCSGDSTAE